MLPTESPIRHLSIKTITMNGLSFYTSLPINQIPLAAFAKFQKTGRKQPKMPSSHPERDAAMSCALVTTAKCCPPPDGPAGEEHT